MRLNKFIAQAGIASRREADRLIEAGHVLINGRRVTAVGTTIDPINDKVNVQGKTLSPLLTKTYLAFYKPRGVTSTMSEDDKSSLSNYLATMKTPGLFHVGRLDKESEGLLLLTNDGEWANRITHPRYEVLKEYELSLDSDLSLEARERLLEGIDLEDGFFKLDSCRKIDGGRIRVEIHDGRNRILRRALEKVGYEILMLKRVRVGSYELGRLRPGEWKEIKP